MIQTLSILIGLLGLLIVSLPLLIAMLLDAVLTPEAVS